MNIKVTGGQTLSGQITPSGSKNSVVALIPATLLFDQPVTLTNVPDTTDVTKLIKLLTHLGSRIISLVMAAMIAQGESIILNADAIHRGHPHFVANLKSLGAKIEEING